MNEAILDIDHPDIREFILCKAMEEIKAQALVKAGYGGSFGGEAYSTVAFQNSNHSVRVTDAFMLADRNREEWHTRLILSGDTAETHPARDLLHDIAKAAHACGDPGIQFDTTINRWHTCPESGRVRASNPCSEYMHVDDSACNLASLRLTAFLDGKTFLTEAFRNAVGLVITAQEILV
ncbi:vitamin B12-dependent ribonucleotide reductase, partial [Thermodesulfobacteriota bacterium]